MVGGLVCVLLAGAELIYFSTRAQGKSEPWQTALTREMKVRGLSEEGEYGDICCMLYIPRPSYPLKTCLAVYLTIYVYAFKPPAIPVPSGQPEQPRDAGHGSG